MQDPGIRCEHPQRLLRGGQRHRLTSEEVGQGLARVSIREVCGGNTR